MNEEMDWKTAFCKLTDPWYDWKCIFLENRIRGVSFKHHKKVYKSAIKESNIPKDKKKRLIRVGLRILGEIYKIKL